MITHHFLLARKHGAVEGFPLLASFGDTQALTRRYQELTGPECAAFAAEHAELLFVSDGVVLHQHEFPNPAEVKKAADDKALAHARRVQAEADAAAADLHAAKARAASAAEALKALPKEQRTALAEEADRQAKSEKAAREEHDRVAKAEAAEQADRDRVAAEAKARADAAAARDTFKAEMAAQSDDQLLQLAADNKLSLPAEPDRDTLIEALAVAAGFPPAAPAGV